MIEDKLFRKTEGMLYKYYTNIKLRDRLEKKCFRLELEKDTILNDIKTTNITLGDAMKAISYSDDIMASNVSSIQEKSLEREMKKLECELKLIISKKLKLKARIRIMDRMISDIEDILIDLSEEEKQLIELKYGSRDTFTKISLTLHLAETTVRRKRKEAIEHISLKIS